MDKPQVFISYSHADSEWARSFAEALKKLGQRVWFDQFEIQAGQSWSDALETGLRDSDVFVTLVERENLHRPNLFFELGAAIGMKKRVVAIVPKDIDPAQLPVELRLRRYLVRDSPQGTAEELSESLNAA
jgi:TIR domain